MSNFESPHGTIMDDMAGTVEDLLHRASSLSSSSLDLSQRNIKHLPEELPFLPNLECLYLKGNELSSLPDKLFSHCPNLRWLDLRYNHLNTLPPDVQNLHCLGTLLLEGNQLTSLPFQLGRLQRLTGLSLADNPLEFPPIEIRRKGVKAVLRYLREYSNEDISEESSSDEEYSNNVGSNSRLPARRRYALTSAGAWRGDEVSSQHELLMKQATLYKIPQASRQVHHPLQSRQVDSRMEQKISSRRKKKRTSKPGTEKTDKELAKQMNEMYLEEWRDSTRRMQMKASLFPSNAHPGASAIAPYATSSDHQHHTSLTAATPSRVNALGMNTQGDTVDESSSSLHQLRTRQHDSDPGEGWVEQIAHQLLENRKGRNPPSQDLANAEKKLAEALNSRREYQARQIREYRLRAFTADAIL